MNAFLSIKFSIGIIFCCYCMKTDLIITILGLILTFIGVVLSYIAIRQTLHARKDIAYNQVKIRQVEATSNLLRYLNQKRLKVYVLKYGESALALTQKQYICNIFELGALLKNPQMIWNDIDGSSPIFLSVESDSILDAETFQYDGYLDANISNALSVFTCIPEQKSLDQTKYQGKTIILLQSRPNSQGLFETRGISDVLELQNNRIDSIMSMAKSIFELENAVSNWYKNNNISDCNISIDKKNMEPIAKHLNDQH